MKLRLPHRLQTAILAAFASVTFFTVGTATLGAAQGEEAPEFASFTDTGFEVSEEELEVDLGEEEEEEEEETKEPDSAPTNHAGFNGIYESSDDADRQLAIEDATVPAIATENVGTADQANYTGTSADLPSNDLGFTSTPYEAGSDTSNGSGVDSPVTSFTQAPQIAPTGGDSAAGIGSGSTSGSSTSNETTTSPVSVFGNIGSGLGAFGGSMGGGYYPAFTAAPTFGAGSGTGAGQTMHVYILTGQSNSQGAVKGNPASTEQLATYISDAIMWNGNFTSYSPVAQVTTTDWSHVAPQQPVYEGNPCMGPEYGFSYMMERFADNGTISGVDQLGILKASLNGGGNGYWVKGTATYNAILSTVETALTKAVANGYTNITIDGLLYLQGESNGGGTTNAGEMYKTFKQNLNDDLATWLNQQDASVKDAITISFVDNSVLGQPSKSPGDTDASQQAAAGTNTDGNHIGYLYTSDMTGSMRYSDNLHFGGSAQLVIGARYAYAFAVQNGKNVGAVRSSNKDQYLDNAMAWWMETLPTTSDVAKWDLSSVSISGGNRIQNSLSIGGIKVEDPYNSNSADARTVYITGGSLSVGSSGIELEKGGLSIASAFNTTANQAWKIAADKALVIGSSSASVALGGSHTISIGEQASGQGAGSVKIYATSDAGHDFTLSNGASLAVNASSTIWNQADVSVTDSGTFGTISNGSLNINSLALGSGAEFDFGGNVSVQLSVNTLTLSGDATFRMNVNSSAARDMLTIGNVSAGSSPYTITFDLTEGSAVRAGTEYVLVDGWNSSLMQAAVAGGTAGAPTLKVVGNQLLVTFAGGQSEDYTKPWVTPTGNPMVINAATFDATAKGGFTSGTASTLSVGKNVSGDVYFYASDSNYTGDVYAELQDASVKWVAAHGSGSSTSVKTLEGSASVKVGQSSDTTAQTVTAVYGAVNADVSGDVYVELDAANYTYGSVNGAHYSKVGGNLTTVIKDGTVTGQTAGGFVNNNAFNLVSGDVRLQIDGGTFNGNVIGGSNGASSVIEGDIHLNLNNGVFKGYVLGGGFAGTYRGDIYVTISGGDFSSSNGIYAGFGSSSGVTAPNADTTVTLFAIDDTNTFAQYTGVLSGGNQAGSTALATRTLDLKGYTAGEVKANLTSFTHVNVLEETSTVIKKSSGASDLGGATSLQVDGSSTLTLNADAAWDASAVTTLTVEEGGILRKIGANNLTLGNISGAGTLAVAEGNATVGTFADATVDVASGSTLTVNNPGTAKVGTLSGAGNVLLNGQINGNTNFVCTEGQWTGSVTITGSNISNTKQELHFNNFGTKGSTVVIDGIGHGVSTSLYLPNGEANAINPNIHLTGNGLTLTDGSSGGNAYFKGNWSGNGGFTFSKASVTQSFTFLGDMHEYSGDMSLSGAQNLYFGNGDIATASFVPGGGSATGTGTISGPSSGTNFSTVTVNYLNDATVGSKLSGKLNLVIDTQQKAILTRANDYTGTTTVNNGSLSVTGDGQLGSGTVTLKNDAQKTINLALGENATITAKGQDATISNHSVVNASSIQGASSSSIATISHANIAVAEGKTLELSNVNLVDTAITGQVDLLSSVNADSLTIQTDSTFKLAGEDMLHVSGALALQAGATLDLARLFATQEEPVQNAPLRSFSNSSPQLMSSGTGDTAGLAVGSAPSQAPALLGASAPAAGDTFVLASAQSIDLANGVNLTNLADGYSGSLSTQAVDGGGYNLILTLNEVHDLVWDGTADGKWDTGNNWHASGTTTTGTTQFSEGDNVQFSSGFTNTAALNGDVNAGTMTIDSGVAVTVNTAGHNLSIHDLDSAGGSLTKTGTGTATFGGSDAAGVTLTALSVTGGSVEFNELVTVTGGTSITPTNNSSVSFHNGLDFTGQGGTYGYALIIGNGITGTLGGTTEITNKLIGVGSGGTLILEDGANVTVKGVYNSTTPASNGTFRIGKNATLTASGSVYATALNMDSGSTLALGANSQVSNVSSTGTINVNGGTLTIANNGNTIGSVNVTGGNLTVSGNQNTIDTLNIASGKTVNLNGGGSGSTIATINSLEGAGNITINSTAGNRTYNLTGDLSQWTGTLTQTSGSGNMNLNISGTSALNGSIENTASGTACNITVNLTHDMDVNGSINYTSGGPVKVNVGDSSHNVDVNFTNTVKASDLTVVANSSASFAKDSTVAKVYGTGDITVSSGTLTVGGTDGNFRDVTVENGATVALNGNTSNDYRMRYTLAGGTLTNTGSGTSSGKVQNDQITLTADSTITGEANFYMIGNQHGITSLTLNQKTLHKTGSNTVELVNTDVTDGKIVISDGAIAFSKTQGTNNPGRVAADIELAHASADNLSGSFKTTDNITISSAVNATASAAVQVQNSNILTLSGTDAAANLAMTGAITGTGSVVAGGAGKVTLSGNNGYSGGTTINAGTLVAGSANALGTGAITVNAGGTLELTNLVSSVSGDMSINQGGTLKLALYGDDNAFTAGTGLTLASGSILDLSQLSISGTETSPITLVKGGEIDDANLSGVDIRFADGVNPESYTLSKSGNNLVLTFTQPEPGKDLIWDGGSDTWDVGTTAHWHEAESTDHITFTNHDNAIFDSASSDATVTVSGAVTAGSVAVEDGANVTIVTGNGNTLGATSGITVEGTLALDGTSISGTLSGDGVVVGNEIPSAANWSKSAVLGDLSLDTAGWTGTVEVGGGHHEFSAPYVVLNTINQLATENSTVRLKGVGGYFDGGTITANIELVNPTAVP